ncbi:unnamed protein product [Hermetia illucens]|uniref:Ionotropic receptor n=1 Tax=Hermetia illucens TaxID=343691 RepID=A0A7R8UHH6_HERIL|nr:uncharacterized protein LOC119647660 [Hermetia illucens]CAD7080664.1 unnamed protein product [Hermetia illucens]
MRFAVLLMISWVSVISIGTSGSPDSFLKILSEVRDQFQLDLFITLGTQNSPTSNGLLKAFNENLSVQIMHYSNLWHPTKQISPYNHGKVVLEKFKRNFLLIAIIDGVAARDALSKQIFALTYRNPMAKVIFFLAENLTLTQTDVQGLIRRCFDQDLIDVVFVQNQKPLEMFTYHPFNDLQIVKLTKVSDFFANRFKNLNSYPLTVLTYNSPPRVMESDKREQIIGYAGHLITSYIEKRNASVKLLPRTEGKSFYLEAIENFVVRNLDMLWGVLPLIHFNIGELSYPILYEKYCVMVPVPRVIPVYRNFLQPFEQDVWVAVICGTFYMTIVCFIVDAILNKRKDLSAALTTSICFIICRGEIGIFSNLNRRLFVIYLFLFLLGFMLSNFYCALLTTFLTSPSHERELKTLTDIAVAGLKIVGDEVELRYIADRDVYKKYHPLLGKLSSKESMKIKSDLNNTNPSFVATDGFEFLDEVQRYQNDIKFKITDICPLDLYLSVVFKDESIFIEDFNSHNLLIQQSGLLNYWKRNAFFEALQSGYLQLKRGNPESGPIQLTLIHLQIAFYVLMFGLIISTSAFLAEKLYYYYLHG